MHIHNPNLANKARRHSFILFWLTLSLLYALLFVGIEFSGSPVNSLAGFIILSAQWLMVSVFASMVIGLLAINRWIFTLSFPLLMIASAVTAYFRLTMGLSLTPMLIELTVVNDWPTRLSVLSLPLFVALIVILAVALIIVKIRFDRVEKPRHPLLWTALFAIVAVVPLKVFTRFREPVSARVPYSFYASFVGWLDNRQAVADHRTTYNDTPVSCPDDAPDVVFVIGESLRPDHLQLNGYHRPTTPLLAADSAVISFPFVTTDWVYTHVSVPRIMTRKDPDGILSAYKSQSFITLMNRLGYDSAWLSNQDEVMTYAYFMHEADTLVQCNTGHTLYGFDKWYDSDLLPHFDNFLGQSSERKLVVLHTIGSHWWYPSHYPDSLARFRPEVDSRIVSELSRQQIINSYDNTILATDIFLSELIKRLRDRNAVLIYISDHGEALGEDGHYLHAADYPQLHSTACLVWTSPEYAGRFPLKVAALKENSRRHFTIESMFHSLLDAASVTTPVLDHSKSLFHNPDSNESDSNPDR